MPDMPQGTMTRILVELKKDGSVKASGPYHNRTLTFVRPPKSYGETWPEILLRTIQEFGGSAQFPQLRQAMGIDANLLAATIATAVKAGKVVKYGEKRHYSYSIAGGVVAPRPRRMRLVSSVFDLGAAHG